MAEVHFVVCDHCGARADGDLTPEGWSFAAEDLCVDCNPNSMRNRRKAAQRTGEESVNNYGEWIRTIEKLAGEVNRDMPGKSLDARMAEAMKRNKGSMNPLMVREALIRTAATDVQSPGEKP